MSARLVQTVDAWWQWMAAVSVQVAFLVVVVACLDRLLRRWAWPQLRAGLWLLVMVKLALPPTLTSPFALSGPELAPGAAGMGSAAGIAFCFWIAGTLLLGTTMAFRGRESSRRSRQPGEPLSAGMRSLIAAVAQRLGMRRAPRILIRADAPGPAVAGVLRPVVVLPADLLRTATPRQIEHVLLHELAHVRRRDPLVSLLCRLLQLVYWFHPMVWLTRRRLSLLREMCCDQTVAGALRGETREYRDTLLHLARPVIERRTDARLAFVHRHSQLLARLESLARPFRGASWHRRLITATLVGTAFLFCVPASQTVPAAARGLPALADLQGCLQLRFAVYAMGRPD